MSADGSFKQHIQNICNSANHMCSWILRTFQSRSPELMLTLWKSLVLPILDYCSQLWSPSKIGQIKQIENVQKMFSRKIKLPSQQNYWDRLKSLNLYSLERRRERYRIIYVWKILEGIVPNLTDRSKITTKSSLRFGRICCIPPLTTVNNRLQNLRDGSFCVNGPKLFNCVPSYIRNLKGIELPEFKKELDKFLRTVADEPLSQGYTAGRRAASNQQLTHFFYKNKVYKNIEAQICLKFKNILRIYLSLISNTRVYYLPSFFEYACLVNSFLASRSYYKEKFISNSSYVHLMIWFYCSCFFCLPYVRII